LCDQAVHLHTASKLNKGGAPPACDMTRIPGTASKPVALARKQKRLTPLPWASIRVAG